MIQVKQNPDFSLLASIIVLTKNGEKYLRAVLSALFSQTLIDRSEVIVIDSGSSDATISIVRDFPEAHLHQIRPEEFGHGVTRNLGASIANGEFLVFIPQDATPASEHWLESLLKPFGNPMIAGVFGRQAPRPEANAMESWFLGHAYPLHPSENFLSDGEEASLAKCFFSTVGGALRASVWSRHPFRNDVVMSEDQAWSKEVMLAGFGIAYSPGATVLHSHQYGVTSIFRRNFDSGYSIHQIFGRSLGIPVREAAKRLVAEARFVFMRGRPKDMLMFLPYELARHFGFWLGLHGDKLPNRLAVACSGLRYFWRARRERRDR